MKKVFFILFIIVFYGNTGNCQLFDYTPIAVKDIEEGLNNISYLRKVLLEHGLKYDSEKLYEGGSISETWTYKCAIKNKSPNFANPFSVVSFQISTWNTDGKPSSKEISVSIYKEEELWDKYADEFFNYIKKSYPEREIRSGFIKNSEDTTKSKAFFLIYHRKDSNIEVEVDDFSVWYDFRFTIYL
jgi:hypothetical protein